ncbi:MAG: M20/M25/M40 family metallo-hydrolase [Phycisphaerales bacterium]|nr:M20/M25/M40 family metallo-hydrolase [Phycisphaerales bacterium]
MSIQTVLSKLQANESAAIDRLIDWLKIPSISTVPAHGPDVRQAAEWAADQIRQSGLIVQIMETGDRRPAPPSGATPARGSGHPIVMAFTDQSDADAWRAGKPAAKSPSGNPHTLFYGHYDVQPADPLELWESPPFEPVIREPRGSEDGGQRIVARGAVDDKGQVMMFLEALRAWKEVSGKPAGGLRLTVLLEGEEESGSANLDRFCRDHAPQLKSCDYCLISDTSMLSREQPAITYGVRGLAYTEVVLHGADQDLHSGLWGGRAPNPNAELCKVLAQLWDAHGRVTIPGFYDSVRPLGADERAAWKKLPFSAADALRKIGLPPEADEWGGQERGYSAMEREWARPTAEINGMSGGYTGQGAKTVIPAKAFAKVSFRLVADQDPARITESFFAWCRDRTPMGCRWEFINHSGGHPATVRTDSPYLRAATRAIKAATGKEAVLIKSGGSIPVAGMLKAVADLDTVFMGFGLDDDRVHSPNEKFELACYRMGARSHAILIDELLKMG